MQMEASECGAACLAMVLAFYGRFIPLEILREDCGVSRDGSKAGNIGKAAKKHGMDVHAFRRDMENLREKDNFPAIIHWKGNHFVVLRGFDPKNALIVDPAFGPAKIPLEQFRESYSGTVLDMVPGPQFVQEGKRSSVLSFAEERLSGSGRVLRILMLVTVLTYFVRLMLPAFSRYFTDNVLSEQAPADVLLLILAMLVTFIFAILAGMLQKTLLYRLRAAFASVSKSVFFVICCTFPCHFLTSAVPVIWQAGKGWYPMSRKR